MNGDILLIEPFEELTTGTFNKVFDNAVNVNLSASGGMLGSKGAIGTGGVPGTLTKSFSYQHKRRFEGFHLFLNAAPAARATLCELFDHAAVLQMRIDVNNALKIELYRGTTLVATSTGTMNVGGYNHVAWLTEIADTSGTSVVKLNNVEVISFLGDTKNSATSDVIAQTRWNIPLSSILDNVIVVGGTGTTWVPEGQALWLALDGNGDTQDWQASSGTNHYILVNEVGPSMDGYVSTSGTNQVELFTLASPGYVSGTIFGIEHRTFADKDEAGARQIKQVLKINGTEYPTSDTYDLTTTPIYYSKTYKESPDTGVEWTLQELEDLQVGVKSV